MLGAKIKYLRESKGLVQREIAEVLEVDIAYVSKMENNEKPVSRHYLKRLARLFEIPENELQTLWLADKLYNLTKDEPDALNAIEVVHNELNITSNKHNK